MLHQKTRRLASGRNLAVLTTLMPDGTPQSHVIEPERVILEIEPDREIVR